MKVNLSLNAGLVSEYDEKKANELPIGTTFGELYDHINKLEVATNYDFQAIVQQLKIDYMQGIGLIDQGDDALDTTSNEDNQED